MSENLLLIRDVYRTMDFSALKAIDTSFTSEFAYAEVPGENSLELRLAPAASPIQKRFLIDLDEPIWDQGYVAVEDGNLCGFIATRFEPWNWRLTIVHFYVDLQWRRRGIGRRLMERCGSEFGGKLGAKTAWVETSNLNHPGILAYQCLRFALCGFDLTLYQGTPSEGEFAIYLACPIAI